MFICNCGKRIQKRLPLPQIQYYCFVFCFVLRQCLRCPWLALNLQCSWAQPWNPDLSSSTSQVLGLCPCSPTPSWSNSPQIFLIYLKTVCDPVRVREKTAGFVYLSPSLPFPSSSLSSILLFLLLVLFWGGLSGWFEIHHVALTDLEFGGALDQQVWATSHHLAWWPIVDFGYWRFLSTCVNTWKNAHTHIHTHIFLFTLHGAQIYPGIDGLLAPFQSLNFRTLMVKYCSPYFCSW